MKIKAGLLGPLPKPVGPPRADKRAEQLPGENLPVHHFKKKYFNQVGNLPVHHFKKKYLNQVGNLPVHHFKKNYFNRVSNLPVRYHKKYFFYLSIYLSIYLQEAP